MQLGELMVAIWATKLFSSVGSIRELGSAEIVKGMPIEMNGKYGKKIFLGDIKFAFDLLYKMCRNSMFLLSIIYIF